MIRPRSSNDPRSLSTVGFEPRRSGRAPQGLAITLLAGMLLASGAARAAAPEATKPAEPAPAPVTPAPVVPVIAGTPPNGTAKPAAPLNETQQYCQNIAAAAADARFAWQRKQLNDLQAQLKQRITDLEVKEAEFKAVIAKRDDLMKTAADTVVGIYAHMKPDAAASQLAALDDDMAAAILAQLTQQKASVILNEIPAEKAAKLIGVMTGAAGAGKKS